MSKVFPKILTFPAVGLRITLFADGSCEGDYRNLELALAAIDTQDRPLGQGELTIVCMWLMLRKLQDDAGVDRRVR